MSSLGMDVWITSDLWPVQENLFSSSCLFFRMEIFSSILPYCCMRMICIDLTWISLKTINLWTSKHKEDTDLLMRLGSPMTLLSHQVNWLWNPLIFELVEICDNNPSYCSAGCFGASSPFSQTHPHQINGVDLIFFLIDSTMRTYVRRMVSQR